MSYTVDYLGDFKTKTVHTTSGCVLFTEPPKDNQGSGEAFSPTDLFAVSLATCMMTLMGMAAKKLNLDLSGSKMQVEKTMLNNPRRIGSVLIDFISSLAVTEEQQELLEKAAIDCPVHKSLHPDIIVKCNFIWGS